MITEGTQADVIFADGSNEIIASGRIQWVRIDEGCVEIVRVGAIEFEIGAIRSAVGFGGESVMLWIDAYDRIWAES